MQFRAEFIPNPFGQKIDHSQQLFLIGSCFTENIGEKLAAAKFSVHQNPNGILFNPVSVANALNTYIDEAFLDAGDLFLLNEAYHSWQFHSRYSSPDSHLALEGMNQQIRNAHEFLKQSDVLIITLGSAWVYYLTEEAALFRMPGQVAANNHKAPASWFSRRLLSAGELSAIFSNLVSRLMVFNPRLRIVFTISPVRHIREGFVENNRSKAALIQAVHEQTGEGIDYFPAYELVIDDLRDYRFYAEDMVHPNYLATNYVWEKFMQTSMSQQTRSIITQVHEINLARNHKPFNPSSEAHRKFLRTFLQKTAMLQRQNPYMDLKNELNYFANN